MWSPHKVGCTFVYASTPVEALSDKSNLHWYTPCYINEILFVCTWQFCIYILFCNRILYYYAVFFLTSGWNMMIFLKVNIHFNDCLLSYVLIKYNLLWMTLPITVVRLITETNKLPWEVAFWLLISRQLSWISAP